MLISVIDYCVYKQRVYQQGQKWNDGCNFICTCEDASRGLYKCDDRCPKYFYLPPQCHYEQDPKDNCCQVAKCDFNPTLTPPPTTTTLPIKTTPGVATQKPNSRYIYSNLIKRNIDFTYQQYLEIRLL